MSTLVVGFDSAWTPTKSGALVGAVRETDGRWRSLGPPIQADFLTAERQILGWQDAEAPSATLVMLDQPTIVQNDTGQRPVENIVASPVSLRYGGVQPANTGRAAMFGSAAPVWRFLDRFGGPATPSDVAKTPDSSTHVLETYPVLALIALGWVLPDNRATGRLPKYNPERRRTFRISDWQHVCTSAASFIGATGLTDLSTWLLRLRDLERPHKRDQDALDACLCLVVGLHLVPPHECLMVGDLRSGYIVVPASDALEQELANRCTATQRAPREWLRRFGLETHG